PPLSTLFPYTTLFRSRSPRGRTPTPVEARFVPRSITGAGRMCASTHARSSTVRFPPRGASKDTDTCVEKPTSRALRFAFRCQARSEEHTSELQSLAYL